MKPAAIYARSTKDRSDISTKTQVHELTTFASSRSLTVVRAFEDAEETGKTEDRPAFGELVAEIKNSKRGWDTLLVYDTSRIARRRYIAQAFKHLAKKSGVQILYLKLPNDLDPVAEVVLESVFEAMDEAHSLMSRDKALAGMRENVRRGWRAGGRAPLGYRLEKIPTGAIRDGKAVTKSRLVLSIDAPKVAEYLRRRAAGEPRAALLRALGVTWKKSTLVEVERRALMYAGHLVWNQRRDDKRLDRSEWVIQRDAHAALITDAEAEAVMAQVDWQNGKKVSEAKRAMSAAMLSQMLVAPDGRRWRSAGTFYMLEGSKPIKKVRRDVLDQMVKDAVLAEVARPDFIEGLIEASREVQPDGGARDSIVREVGRLTRERDKAARLALESDDDVYTRLVQERGRQIAGLQRELAALTEDDETARRLKALTPHALREWLEDRDISEIVQALVERVVIGPDGAGTVEFRAVGFVSLASPRGFEPRSQP